MRSAVLASLLASLVPATIGCGGGSTSRPDARLGIDGAIGDGDAALIDAAPSDGIVDPVFDGPIDAPGDAAIDGMTPATQVLRINEVNANATNCDLIELRAIAGGDLTGLRVYERKTLVFTFPAMTVPPNALLVLHFKPGACNQGTSANETLSPTEQPKATYSTNYDGAYDLFTADAGLTATDNVISVMRTTTVLDAVLLSDAPTGTTAGDSDEQAAIVAAQNEWVMVGGGTPTGGFTGDNYNAHAALDLDATGATPAGTSIQRLDDSDDNDKADWNSATVTVQPSTWGALNVG